ncbi:MAG: TIGR04283 family arsenosugar biosynthesis glycosyltransferase [Rhizobacter sp.]|nr:TIGR04283 family arsenosugar biosynthesis glycosyltransferase [Rhizobacter sp.]
MSVPQLSIILPVLNEAEGIAATLDALAPLRAAGHQLIVVDGGSHDHTVLLSRERADEVLDGPRGRARQMNAGAAVASGEVLLFLHADTRLPPAAGEHLAAALAHGAVWGRFDVHIEGRSRWLPLVASLMNLRSRLSGIATGDQAMFVRRDVFQRLGGFADQPLMEDIELSCRLRAVRRPACLRARVVTSGRRWDSRGAWPTIVLMWRLRWRYWRGVAPDELAKAYR